MGTGNDAVNNGVPPSRAPIATTTEVVLSMLDTQIKYGGKTDELKHIHKKGWFTGETGITTFQLQTINGGL